MLKVVEQYIDLLESFKTYKVSSIIDQVNLRIFAALKSSYFNPKVAQYFTDLPIDPAILALDPTPENADKINKFIQDYYAKMPLKGFETEPDNVTQIKKLLNALYYGHNAFKDLENIDLKKDLSTSVNTLSFLYQKTVEDAYQACYLLTHVDVDVQEMFQEELQLIYPAMAKLNELVEDKTEQTKALAEELKNYPLSFKAGEITGIALEQMRPSTGNLDFNFLTQFSAQLPNYIDKVTQYIQKYSTQIIAQEPALNNKKIEELQATALGLLTDLETVKSKNRLFVSFKLINYIRIINKIINLSQSSLEQLGHLSDSSQDLIRDNLAQLKYDVFPQLFGLVDKIEVNCMLTPGTLSHPLMEKVKPLYDSLIYYAKKPVNFDEKGEELLSIEDSRFVTLRLEKTYKRIDTAEKALFKIDKIKKAADNFYALLQDEKYSKLGLSQLPKEIKVQLIEQYKIIKPYMNEIDADLNQQIINSLLETPTVTDYFTSGLNWLKGKVSSEAPLPADHLSKILATKESFYQLVEKKTNTQNFHIELNTNLIDSVLKTTNLKLFPYSESSSIITNEALENLPVPNFPPEKEGEIYALNEADPVKLLAETDSSIHYVKQAQENTIINPEALSADQTLIVYQWYQHKLDRFQEAKKAYNQFIRLVEEQLEAHYPIPPQTLNFHQLDEANKQKLRTLYQKFNVYFMNGTSKAIQPLASSFEQHLNPSATNPIIDAAPILADFNRMNSHFEKFFEEVDTRLTQKSQFYFKQAKHKYGKEEQDVFLIDEARALRLEGELDPALHFSIEKGKKLVTDPKQLTANQALTLKQWYSNKRDKLALAKTAYDKFINLLAAQSPKHASSDGPKLTLNDLDSEVKIECRKLYNLFQPYFINGMPEGKRQEALAFDRYLVHSFAEQADMTAPPALDLFEQYNEHFQIYFTDQDLSWRRKGQLYSNLAQEKFTSENSKASLAQDPNAHRANYLLKHTHYSNFLVEFRATLQQYTGKFNEAMQKELALKSSYGVPYPELQDKYSAAAQSKQVLAIKEIYNGLYHIEQILKQLEQLNDKSYKTVYVYYLVQAYSQVDDLIKLAQNLSKDEHLKLIGKDILEKTQNIWAVIQENIEPYQTGAEEVAPLKEKVQFSGIWYTLNAFNVIPKHVRSLRNASTLTQSDLDELNVSAKKASIAIEKIINSSDSYFKLFLQAPTMLKLFREFKDRLNEFISTIHDTAFSNLGEFNSKVFTPMLLEADEWEYKLGLAPGTFSDPLKKMLDEYYKGLLTPLKLSSKTHLEYICDKSSISKRAEPAQQKLDVAKAHLVETETQYAEFIALHKLIEEYNELTGSLFSSPDKKEVDKLMEKIAIAYKAALPRLVAFNRQLNYIPHAKLSEEDMRFDVAMNAGLKDYDKKLTDVRALVKLGHAHYLGLKNTYTTSQNSADEQLRYLKRLDAKQDIANEEFIQAYTEKSFDQQARALAYRHVGLQYTHKEYSAKLEAYLVRLKKGIVTQAKTETDINKSVADLLTVKIAEFEQEHFAHYHQLDRIKSALTQFYNYFSISATSIYENKESISKKDEEIKKLFDLAEDEIFSAETRIENIQEAIDPKKNPGFSNIILAERSLVPGFEYIKYCVLALLKAVGLYTPEKDQRLKELQKAAVQKHSVADLNKRFGLFATKDKEPEVVQKPVELSSDQEDNLPPLSAP